MKESLEPQTALAPIPAVMVSCSDGQRDDIITIAWTGVINSEPPLVYISVRPTRYSYDILRQSKEFVINLPSEDLVWQTDFCGTKSGREVNKFQEAHLTKEASKVVKAPSIQECPVNIECRVKEIKELGSHHMFIGEIVHVNAEESLLVNGKLDLTKANLLSYFGSTYYVADKKVADRGICLK